MLYTDNDQIKGILFPAYHKANTLISYDSQAQDYGNVN